jgi:L-cysteine S-thiosulfotransferase
VGRRLTHRLARFLAVAACATVHWNDGAMAETLSPFRVTGDAVVEPLGGFSGDVARGRGVVLDRTRGNCLICHVAPEPRERFMGDLAPPLNGVGGRLSEAQIRLRVIDQRVINPKTIMPAYYATAGLTRVAAQYRGQPALTAQEIEDAVAYLATLKE